MARVIPDHSGLKLPKHLSSARALLKKIENEHLECRIALPTGNEPLPDFFLREGSRVMLLCVSPIDDAFIEDVLQGDLFASQSKNLRQDEFALKERQTLDAACTRLSHLGSQNPTKCILFTKASRGALNPLLEQLEMDGYLFLTREECPDQLTNYLTEVSPQTIHRLLERYGAAEPKAPEREEGGTAPPPPDLFFDPTQEELIKIDLDLSEKGRAMVDPGTRLITGCAGSGKTVILLHRARLLAEFNTTKRILVLTHNKPLCGYLVERFNKLSGSEKVTFSTFYSWIASQPWLQAQRIISGYEAKNRIEQLLESESSAKGLKPEFLHEEFNWIYDHDLIDPAEYMKADRRGRKRGLSTEQRDQVHRLFIRYHERLAEENRTDWSGQAWNYLQALRSGRLTPAPYDAILIDEAQFFVPTWFAAIKASLKEGGHLLLTADPTQGFLGSGRSWESAGLELVGRSRKLKTPYRNTREILEFAARFYTTRLPEDDEPVQLPEANTLEKLRRGHIPQPIQFDDAQSENNWVCRQILEHIKKGEWKPEQILVLHEDSQQIESLARQLNKQHPDLAIDAKEPDSAGKLRICSLNATTGLEAGIVFILGVDKLFDKERDLQLDPADQPELIRRHTRKIYTALTRAMRECVICFRHPQARSILRGEKL